MIKPYTVYRNSIGHIHMHSYLSYWIENIAKVTFKNFVIPTPTTNTLSLPLSKLRAVAAPDCSLHGAWCKQDRKRADMIMRTTAPSVSPAKVFHNNQQSTIWSSVGKVSSNKNTRLDLTTNNKVSDKKMWCKSLLFLLFCFSSRCCFAEQNMNAVFDLWDSVRN